MRCLIIGYGSIGARHARLLEEQGHDVHALTQNTDCPYPTHATLEAALADTPDAVVISNRTADHLDSLRALHGAGFTGRVLLEKPVFATTPTPIPNETGQTSVAYNLRFHPMIQRIRELTRDAEIHCARLHVGQHLPDWRPDADYRKTYSAFKETGGGVIRDLSHELDLATWLLGPWQRLTAITGHVSDLDIESEDVCAVLMSTTRCPAVSVHLDYLSRIPHRCIEINAKGMTIHGDLLAGKLKVNGDLSSYAVDRDSTYDAQMRAFLADDESTLCSFTDGLGVLGLIEAIERASQKHVWVEAQ